MESEFYKKTVEINQKTMELQDAEKEVVSEEDVAKAYACIREMAIREAGDCLLYCSALNMCNTYVKQPGAQKSYAFKKDIDFLLDNASCNYIDDLHFDLQKDKNMSLLVVEVGIIQFSYHNIAVTQEIKNIIADERYKKTLEWDGIRKQNCAVTLFNLAYDNTLKRCNETFRGKDLDKKVNKIVQNFKEGKMSLHDIRHLQ